MTDLNIENYRMLLYEIKEALNKWKCLLQRNRERQERMRERMIQWKYILCSKTERLNIIKMTLLPKYHVQIQLNIY